MNGTNMWFDDIYVNSTALDAKYGVNWVQNTDGFDTMDARNVALTIFVYQGRQLPPLCQVLKYVLQSKLTHGTGYVFSRRIFGFFFFSREIHLTFSYNHIRGDDADAVKPRSYNIYCQNVWPHVSPIPDTNPTNTNDNCS